MLLRKVNRVKTPPRLPLQPTLSSKSVEELVEVKNTDGKVISSKSVKRSVVVPMLETDLVSTELAEFYSVPNVNEMGIDKQFNGRYFNPDLDSFSEASAPVIPETSTNPQSE